jgi:hypothetical protein
MLHRLRVEHAAALETHNMGVNVAEVMNPLILFAEHSFQISTFHIIQLSNEIAVVIYGFAKVFDVMNIPIA